MSRPPWKSSPGFKEIDDDIKILDHHTSILPRVDASGSSPCSFAAQMFGTAAKDAEKLKEDIGYLRQDLDDAWAAKRKAKEAVDAAWVQMGVGNMDLDEYEDALPALKRDVQYRIEHITDIENKIAECEKALSKALPRIERGAMLLQ